ncbi:MAG: DUF2807 domain-containing protein [Tannerella sp.]|jgi:hypothetical protein|nr:DUF2807 domain-containing protein [Tannerella sp.]
MKKVVTLLMVCGLAATLTSCLNVTVGNNGSTFFGSGKRIVGNGNVQEKEIGKLDFTEIESRNSIDVFISSAADIPVKVSGDENLIDYVEVKVENGILKVQMQEGLSYSTKNALKVIVPNNGKIRRIAASGSSDVTSESVLTADGFILSCKGSSGFRGDIAAVNCDLDMSGSSDFRGSVKADGLKLDVSGSSGYKGIMEAKNVDIHCSASSGCQVENVLTADDFAVTCSGSSNFSGDIVAVNGDLKISSSSDFKGNIKAEKLNLSCKGSSDYKGNMETKNVDILCESSSDCIVGNGFADVAKISVSGSSDFKGYDFTARHAECSASGSSDIQITCTDKLSVHASGSSDIYYKGHPNILSLSISGSSNVYER